MAIAKKATTGRKKTSATSSRRTGKASSSNTSTGVIKPGSFLDRRGGMVPTVRLGKRASQKAV
jgi:hypothetical protein